MYLRVLLNRDRLTHMLKELLEISKANKKGKINARMSPFHFTVGFWAAFCSRLYCNFPANSGVTQHGELGEESGSIFLGIYLPPLGFKES